MEYVAQLPGTRKMIAPLVALVIGAAGAVGAYALIDDTNAGVESTKVIVTETPAPPSAGVAAKHEAGTAAAIAGKTPVPSVSKDEAKTAAAVAGSRAPVSSIGKDEAKSAAAIGGGSTSPQLTREQELRTDPLGQKAYR
jgi:hypothetical protein